MMQNTQFLPPKKLLLRLRIIKKFLEKINRKSANEHVFQNGEFYFRTVFHFRTNHEAAGSRTGSGAFRNVPLNWFLPQNHCFLTFISYRIAFKDEKTRWPQKISLVMIILA